VPVPVPDELDDEPRLEVRPGVAADGGARPQALPRLLAVDRLERAPETRRSRVLLDVAENAAELLAEAPERRVVGQDDEARVVVEEAGRLHERADQGVTGGMARALGGKEGERDLGRVALLALQARPEGGVDERLDGRAVGKRRDGRRGGELAGEVALLPRGVDSGGRV